MYAIRRTDNYWCALESDTAIECLLMRSIKSRTGLTRGSGMTEFRRNVWLGSAPVVAAVREDVRILTGGQRESFDQHKECGRSRMSIDKNHAAKFLSFFASNNPFHVLKDGIENLATGEVFKISYLNSK